VDTTFQKEQKLKSPSLWKRVKTVLLLSSLLGLLSANLATLVSDSFHTAAFNTLKSVLGHALPGTVLMNLLSHSPTAVRTTDVAVKTKELTDKNTRLIRNNTELEEKHAKLKTESARKAEAVQKASKRMATRSVAGATRNITSLAGQAIPLFGTTLIVGVTAWDIHDFCQNIKDLNELSDVFEHHLEDQDTVCGMEVPTKEKIMADARENWQEAYRTAAHQIELSHENAKGLITQKYKDAKEQAILGGEDLEDRLEETYKDAIEKINQINTRIQIPPLTVIWKTVIDKIYKVFGKFTQ
jgi:DNA anti-recombination protein RmuC